MRRSFDGLGSPVSNDADRSYAASVRASLMFGEILFNGVTRILDADHMNAASARTLYDLGSGCGRLCVQAFLQFPNLERVVGVELTSVRSKVGFIALTRLAKSPPKAYAGRCSLTVTDRPHLQYSLTVAPPPNSHEPSRTLELRQMNLFECTEAWQADTLICETNIDASMQYDFLHFLSHCKAGCRLLTYNNLEQMHEDVCSSLRIFSLSGRAERKAEERGSVRPPFPWKRMAINTFDDKFEASWGMIRFHLYVNTAAPRSRSSSGTSLSTTSSSSSSTASTSQASSPSASFASISTPRSMRASSRARVEQEEEEEDEE